MKLKLLALFVSTFVVASAATPSPKVVPKSDAIVEAVVCRDGSLKVIEIQKLQANVSSERICSALRAVKLTTYTEGEHVKFEVLINEPELADKNYSPGGKSLSGVSLYRGLYEPKSIGRAAARTTKGS